MAWSKLLKLLITVVTQLMLVESGFVFGYPHGLDGGSSTSGLVLELAIVTANVGWKQLGLVSFVAKFRSSTNLPTPIASTNVFGCLIFTSSLTSSRRPAIKQPTRKAWELSTQWEFFEGFSIGCHSGSLSKMSDSFRRIFVICWSKTKEVRLGEFVSTLWSTLHDPTMPL